MRSLILALFAFLPSRRSLSVALVPTFILGAAITRNAVNIPVGDQWELVPLFKALHEGHLSWRDVTAVHNEHRYAIPNVYFLWLGRFTAWDVRWEIWTTFGLACITVVCVLMLLRSTGVQSRHHGGLTLLVSLTILNPALVENWLWGYQVAMLVPPLCLFSGMVIASVRLSPSAQLAGATLLATVASFSFGNGLIVWILIPAVVICSPTWSEFRSKRVALTLAFLAMFACLTLYLWEFPATSNLEPFRQRASFGSKIEYWLDLLGAPVAAGVSVTPRRGDLVCGALLITMFAIGSVATWRSGRRVMRVWVVLGLFSGVTAAIVTAGRVGIDDARMAFTSRYLLFAGPLVISTAVLWAERLSRAEQHEPSHAVTVLLTTIIVLQILAAARGIEHMALVRQQRLQGKALLAFVDHVEEPGLRTKVYPWSGLRSNAHVLNQLHYLLPPLVPVPWRPPDRPIDSKSGRFERLTVRQSALEAEGWAVLTNRREAADAVVLAVETSTGCCTIVAVSNEREAAPTMRRLGRDALVDTGWRKSIPLDRIPADGMTMRAWAYDAITGRSVELPGRHKIDLQKTVP